MNIIGIIPARYGSTRFPGKPLATINGKTMIRHVYENASRSAGLARVVVATDDRRIFEHVKSFNGEVLMTSTEHGTGTERVSEALLQIESKGTGEPWDVIVNIQGDEPFIAPEQIDLVISLFHYPDTDIGTLARQISNASELEDPDTVKVVMGNEGRALYFSRYPVPYIRSEKLTDWPAERCHYKHIGIYGYRNKSLKEIVRLPPGRIESAESLEQLRWLENGYMIRVGLTTIDSISVDTPEDLSKITNMT